ncbi:MAG: HAD family hydrolase [Armatimonadetes bacterium]|nr:HAD family hydrolase [Armatimonadota bacterium]
MPVARFAPQPRKEGLRAVVFDFDGTIADTRIDFALMRRRVTTALKAMGAWEDTLGEGRYVLEMVEAAAALARQRGLDHQAILQAAEEQIRAIEYEACRSAELCEGAEEALARLKAAGMRIGLITRNCSNAVEMVLSRNPLPIDTLIPRDLALRPKPDPAHLLQALEALRVGPRSAALVGDHVTDVQCAKGAQVALAVAVAGASSSVEELEAAGADFVALHLREATDFLLNQGERRDE